MNYKVKIVIGDLSVVASLNGDAQVAKNFKLRELCNTKAGEDIKLVYDWRVGQLVSMAQELRNMYGHSIDVSSWFRTPAYNAKCNGSKNSLHLDGLAFDWCVKHSATQHKQIETMWRTICERHKVIGGFNHYTNGYHLCIGEEKFGNTRFTVRDYRGTKSDW